ncbi:Limonene-12-epoxide hydrolase [Sphingobium chlorophenolicum L-1]|uniref:Limonene-12-epoxide hydrolase n=1 Tax=Sphingobium chlorophenolicum L-1 TaxID=690566 RepID=F6F3C9_SPHCR|nr:limonene-1,2-epoxide hydrolase family protein [Sphingobium chlorophenolicum]AEG50941.1 Limonene-12-epoxide hydrolase [Sphingobium chlorophenolicum L-1]
MTKPLTPAETVRSFIQCFNQNRLEDALEYLAEDVFYHNIPLEPIVGREATRAFMAEFDLGNSLRAEWEILALATDGETVLTERIDKFYRAGGPREGIPLMGSFRVQDGKITVWRDYFDLTAFQNMVVLHTPRT